jgi:hypothetical protein
MSTSLPFPSSPHCVPSTAQTWLNALNESSPSLLPSLSYFFTFPTFRCVTCAWLLTPPFCFPLPIAEALAVEETTNSRCPSVEFRLLEREVGRSHKSRGIGTARRRRGGVSWCKRSMARMCGEDETMDLHSHCCRCHTVSVRRTSIHTPVGERNKCALCRRRRGRGARRRVQKESANAFEFRRLVFSHKPYLPVVFLGLLVCSQIGYYP